MENKYFNKFGCSSLEMGLWTGFKIESIELFQVILIL